MAFQMIFRTFKDLIVGFVKEFLYRLCSIFTWNNRFHTKTIHTDKLVVVKITGTELNTERDTVQFPVVIFCTGTHVTGISLHAKTGRFQFTLQSFYCSKNLITALSHDDRNDNNLCWGDRCRKYQSFVIPVHTNDCSNTPLGDTVTGL